MKITLLGAAGGEVTGSAYLVETARSRVLVDFGFFQGIPHAEDHNHLPPGLEPARLDAVLLTHAHLDHTGRLPLLPGRGFHGPLLATAATLELSDLILRDSAKVQAQDLARVNRKRERAGEPPLAPLYGVDEVARIMARGQPVAYDQPVPVTPDLEAVFLEAGHLLGSASIHLRVREDGRVKTVVFSGDLGPRGVPILRDAVCRHLPADLVFLESTYGDHNHQPFAQTVAEFYAAVREAVAHRGKILVPTFAVGRAQLLLVLLAVAFRRGQLPKFPLFLDSPMAAEASRIYLQHPELYDEDLRALGAEHSLLDDLDTLKITATAEESRALNDVPGPCLILAGSGMCNAGRILHHLRQNLWRPETRVLIVGYQAAGTLGRLLVERAPHVQIFGEKVVVRARVHTLGGFSAHAGQNELLDWLGCLADARPRVCLTHGEAPARRALAARVRERFGIEAALPELGETVPL
jgi:metallo-beta-lactamase family protein